MTDLVIAVAAIARHVPPERTRPRQRGMYHQGGLRGWRRVYPHAGPAEAGACGAACTFMERPRRSRGCTAVGEVERAPMRRLISGFQGPDQRE